MGMMPSPKNCYVTGLNTQNFPSSWDLVEYIIEIKGKRLLFRFNLDHINSSFVESYKHILYGLILNDRFPREYYTKDSPILDNKKLEELIRWATVPKTPEEKIAHLLDYLHSLQKYEGSEILFPKDEDEQDLARRLYFKNYDEMVFYLFTLYNQGLIDAIDASTKDGADLIGIKLTYSGLSKVIEVNKSGDLSNKCFVAMSFSDDLKETRQSIKDAIIKAGFTPVLIDEIHFDAHLTINDALISEIRRCRFLVADFTQHKHGVYFETGFALGIERPVIYLCHKDDFSNSHFDTSHYPHILYSDSNELTDKLIAKIEAWIK